VLSELEPLAVLALVLTGVAAGFANVVAGGGSLLSVPLLIFLGLPEGVANGTSRIAILAQNVVAMLRYRRQGQLDARLVGRMAAPALLGAGLGAWWATRLDDSSFRSLFGWVMLGCALLIALNPKPAAAADGAAGAGVGPGTLRVWLVLFGIGLYGGLIQAGVGYLILAALPLWLGCSLVQANVLKVVIVGLYTPIALFVFWRQGQLAFWPGLWLTLGQSLGAWLGVQEVLRRGERLIRVMLVLSVLLGAAELLDLY
jgi:uncharacterized membrane protein YfcA